ncbi:MAG: CoA-binding protein [Pseudomonadota bacterium]
MIESIENHLLHRIVSPRSIAFFGASNRFTTMGTNQLHSLKSLGFQGAIYPIHPKEDRVLDLKAYRDVMDLPEIPDLAVMVLPTSVVLETLEKCGRLGIRQAIIVSGGFKEVGGSGSDLEKKLITIARHYGIRFLGPNCLGVTNPHHKLNTTFLPYIADPGFIGFASQSGSFITQMFDYLAALGLGFSTALSVGNEADIDLVDCLDYLALCPHTKVIGLYIEGLRRGRAFIEAARRIVPHKPIVAYYVGGSEAGKRAGLSHTGALAGPDRLYDGVFNQSGIIRANSMTELFDFCWVLGSCPPPRGNRLIIQTHSGGPGATAADACGRAGLDLTKFSQETIINVSPYVPHTGSLNNPLDITFSKNHLDFFQGIPKTLLADPNGDGLLIYLMLPEHHVKRGFLQMGFPEDQLEDHLNRLAETISENIMGLPKIHQKPVIGFSYRSQVDRLIRLLQKKGFPVLPSPERAARAMAALVRYQVLRQK